MTTFLILIAIAFVVSFAVEKNQERVNKKTPVYKALKSLEDIENGNDKRFKPKKEDHGGWM